MSNFVLKLSSDCYVMWSKICDTPSSFVLNSLEAREEFGGDFYERLVTSGIKYNKAGPYNTRVSVQEIIRLYNKNEHIRNSYKEFFINHKLFWLRNRLGVTRTTLPKYPFEFFTELFGDGHDLSQRVSFDIYDNYWNSKISAFMYESEAIIAAMCLKSNKKDISIEKFFSTEMENGLVPDLDLIDYYIKEVPKNYEAEHQSFEIFDEYKSRSKQRDLMLIRGILNNWR